MLMSVHSYACFMLSVPCHESARVTECNPSMNELVLSLVNNSLTEAHSSEQVDQMTSFVLSSQGS